MRRLARVSLKAEVGDGATLLADAERMATAWLESKGPLKWLDDEHGAVAMKDDRVASVDRRAIHTAVGEMRSLTIREETTGGWFVCELTLAASAAQLALLCDLEGGQGSEVITPTWFDVRLPRVVRDLLRLPVIWVCGREAVAPDARRAAGKSGGRSLGDHLVSPARTLPAIVVSDHEGLVLHPEIEQRIAKDLAGLAFVYRANAEAAWELTSRFGKELSCYQGAVRLYWPRTLDLKDAYRQHPLWTPTRLLDGGVNTEQAEEALRATLRRRVYGASTLALERPSLIADIEREHRRQLLVEARAKGATELDSLFDEVSEKLDRLEQENQRLSRDNANLEARLEALAPNYEQAVDGEDEVSPISEAPADSVGGAIDIARRRWADALRFGGDVDDGTRSVDADAGPPEKVLHHLDQLAKMAMALRDGELGVGYSAWLSARGVHASGEDAAMMRNKRERDLRKWDDGRVRRVFEWHTKPSDATAPSRCVRIYFDWDESTRKVIVAWVGRKPGV